MRSTTIIRPPVPLRQGSDWHRDSDLAALTIRQGGEQHTWRNDALVNEPLIDAWAATALAGGRPYCRLTMAGLAALRNA